MSDKEVAKIDETEQALALFEGQPTGLDDLDTGVKPKARYLKIAQATTQALKKDSADFIKGLSQGEFYSPYDGVNFGEAVDLVVIGYGRFYVEYIPPERKSDLAEFVAVHNAQDVERGHIDDAHQIDVESAEGNVYKKWAMRNGNELRATHNIMVAAVHEEKVYGPYVLTLSKTNYYPGGLFMNKVREARLPSGKPAPINSIVWRLKLTLRDNGSKQWYAIGERKANVERVRFVTPAEFGFVNAMRKEFEEMVASGNIGYADTDEAPAPSDKPEETEF